LSLFPLKWSDDLLVGEPVMDATHQEFVSLLTVLGECGEHDALARLDAFMAHTDAHFAQESRWMTEMGFTAADCHEREHEMVLETAQAVRAKLAAGEAGADLAKMLALGVAQWFSNHAASMDAVLALYMKEQGYAPTPGG
jgi:hemerythrin